MKTIIKIIALFILSMFSFSTLNAEYELTNKDWDTVDVIDEKIYNLVDNNRITPEKVVRVLSMYIENNDVSEKLESIIEIVIDDIEYAYYLGEYSNDFSFEMTKNDCYDDEYFDEVKKMCIYEMYNEKDDLSEEYLDDNFSNNENISSKPSDEIIATYFIDGDSISLDKGKSDIKHNEIWNLFAKMIPASFRTDFALFKVTNNQNSDTFAEVRQNESDIKKWDLIINISTFYVDGNIDKKESTHTLIHEFAHVLTLSKAQVKYVDPSSSDMVFERSKEKCTTNFVMEGCLNHGGYLNEFINKFWSENFESSQNSENNDFYTGNEDNFVTDYAATNPGEDIAESFTYFILKKKPSGNLVSDKKILFFYDYDELVKLRNVVRMRLSR